MATKQFYATGAFKYGTRMLTAGDPVEMDGPTSRLYTHLGKITDRKPRAAAAPSESATPKPAAKKTTKKRATAKK
jgi:hypothetical protein